MPAVRVMHYVNQFFAGIGSEDKADVTPDFQIDRGVGASDAVSGRLDSRIGVQLNAGFSDNFSGVVQAVSEYAVTKSYRPEFTLAHVKYRFSSAFSARSAPSAPSPAVYTRWPSSSNHCCSISRASRLSSMTSTTSG